MNRLRQEDLSASKEFDDPTQDIYEEDEQAFSIPQWLRDTPYWAVSAALHVVLFAILLVIFTSPPNVKEDLVPISIKLPPEKPEKKYDPSKKRKLKDQKKILHEEKVENPVIIKTLEPVTPDIPKGTDLDKQTDVDLKGDSISDAIAVGGGFAGKNGQPYGHTRRGRIGGTEESTNALISALKWLQRHQREDGGWSSKDFSKECSPQQGNLNSERYPTDQGFEDHDVGVTGLAMLAFTGFGQTHIDGDHPEFVEVLRKAVKFMKSQQIRSADKFFDGTYGKRPLGPDGEDLKKDWIYNHAIATMAMAELLAMSGDKINLEKSVTSAVNLCLLAQNNGLGWKYGIKDGRNDTSVTGWMVLALKAAKYADLKIPRSRFNKAFEGALNWFDSATSEASGKTGYEVPGDEGSRLGGYYPDDPYPYSKDLSCMTAVSVLCRLFAGESRTDPTIKRGASLLMMHTPQWREQEGEKLSTINMYYWYYASYAMFQFGGKLWEEWNKDLVPALLSSQRQAFHPETVKPYCVDGSWDPIGEWGIAGGRVYSTAIGAMTLEVYYRYVRNETGETF